MDIGWSIQVLAGVCGLVLLIVVMKQKKEFFLTLLLRVVVGFVVILWGNRMCADMGIEVVVGLNILSLLTSATLGIPGVALLFSVSALSIL